MGLGRAELVVGLQLLNWLKKPLRWSAEEAGVLVDSSIGCYYGPQCVQTLQ